MQSMEQSASRIDAAGQTPRVSEARGVNRNGGPRHWTLPANRTPPRRARLRAAAPRGARQGAWCYARCGGSPCFIRPMLQRCRRTMRIHSTMSQLIRKCTHSLYRSLWRSPN